MGSNFIVYALICPATGEIRYVGKSEKGLRRPMDHFADARRGGKYRVHLWLRKIGIRPEIVTLASLPSATDLCSAERYWISYFRSIGCPLTNLTDGGEGVAGLKRSLAVRRKIVVARAKQAPPFVQNHSEATRARMSRARGGRAFWASNGQKFTTLSEASAALGIDRTMIGAVLRGKRATTHGLSFSHDPNL
jgi:hypothetical protein